MTRKTRRLGNGALVNIVCPLMRIILESKEEGGGKEAGDSQNVSQANPYL